jgi:hypothetical protein
VGRPVRAEDVEGQGRALARWCPNTRSCATPAARILPAHALSAFAGADLPLYMALHGRFPSISVLIHLNTHKKNKILKGKKKIKNNKHKIITKLIITKNCLKKIRVFTHILFLILKVFF